MVRFIFVCMAVVALSFASIAFQSVTDGISSEQQEIAARNAAVEQETVAVIEEPQTTTAEELNDIEAAAGGFGDDNGSFGPAFTDEAPKALADETIAAPSLDAAPVSTP